ncbi:MAG: hypothetical protein M3217_01700 [Actinomycetota bacterium]|nr:hypothetical protein [Actinomycetota bacterium]
MALRLLAIDLPPLVRDLMAKALLRSDAEGVFVDLPVSGGDVEALAFAARADAVVTPLEDDAWPLYCGRIVRRGGGLPVVGLNWNEGSARLNGLRTFESRRTDQSLVEITIDDVVDVAGRAARIASQPPNSARP